MTRIYNLTLCSKRESDAYRLRSEIEAFLDKRGGCRVVGGGLSCVDPSCTDLDVRFASPATARSSITALRATYSDRCGIDVN